MWQFSNLKCIRRVRDVLALGLAILKSPVDFLF
jgi:hypothetical protein